MFEVNSDSDSLSNYAENDGSKTTTSSEDYKDSKHDDNNNEEISSTFNTFKSDSDSYGSNQSTRDLSDLENEENNESLEDPNNLEKMILSTGIRVGTPIKTKFMASFITRANPEGLYILDISKTLARIDVAAKFIGRTNISNVAVTSSREYGKTPIEKFCELTGATVIYGRFMPGTFTNPSLPKYLEPEIVIVN